MNRLENLKRYVEPPKPVCKGCKTLRPECVVPVGDGSAPMCWLCAHLYIEHDVELAFLGEGSLHEHKCKCTPEDVYPADVLAKQKTLASTLKSTSEMLSPVVTVGKDANRRKSA